MDVTGTSGNDNLSGTPQGDTFDLSQGGNDRANGGAGVDIFNMGATFNAGDRINGGAGEYDTLNLDGDYSAGLTLGAKTMTNIESVVLAAGHSYNLTTNDGNVAAGTFLGIDASALGAGDSLVFNGSAETDGQLGIGDGAGNDILTGGQYNDIFALIGGGSDEVHGGAGNDEIRVTNTLDSSDIFDGGKGVDILRLVSEGTSFPAVVLGAKSMTSIETLAVSGYDLTTNDGNVAAGKTLVVELGGGGVNGSAAFNGAAETDGHFYFLDGYSNDSMTGGRQSDTFDLSNGGDDVAKGGGGNDLFDFGRHGPDFEIPAFTSDDRIDGGGGTDVVALGDDMTVRFKATTMIGVELLKLWGGDRDQGFHSYDLKTADATVAPGRLLTVDASKFGIHSTLTFNGGLEKDGRFHVIAGAGDDVLTGGAGNDVLNGGDGNNTFNLLHGGNDKATGGAGTDTFLAGINAVTSRIDGGAGNDILELSNNSDKATTFGATSLKSVETIDLAGRHTIFNLTMSDGNVRANETLTVDASKLAATDGFSLFFNGSAETNGHFVIFGSQGSDQLTGGQQSDIFNLNLHGGGNDSVSGQGGDDTFNIGSNYAFFSRINGGAGNDTLALDGNYGGHSHVIQPPNFASVETITAAAGHDYDLTMENPDVVAGATLTIDAHALGVGDTLDFNGSAERNSHFVIDSGNGTDDLQGGTMADTFIYNDGIALSGATRDIITKFDFVNDVVKFAAISGVDASVTAGAASAGSIDTNLTNLFGAGQASELGAHHAVLFTASSGGLSGHTFLIVDGDGVAGYTSGADLVIQLEGALHTGDMGTANFSG